MDKLFYWSGFILICIIGLLLTSIFAILLSAFIWRYLGVKRIYPHIVSWVWFYILRKTLPTENIRWAYKNVGYWKYAAKYRLRNIKKYRGVKVN